MTKTEIIEKVAGKGWFKGLTEGEVEGLVERSKVRKYKSGEFIYMVGDSQASVFCILDGQVSISIIESAGDEFGLTILESGSWFGEGSLHDDGVMPLEARAKTPVELLILPISALDACLVSGEQFYRNIMGDMLSRAKLMYKLVEILLFRPLRARVAMRVLFLIEQFGEPQENGDIVLPLKFSQSDFAKMSGGSRQRVNQIFRAWAERELVSKQNKRYVVHDLEGLQEELEAIEDD